MSHARWNDTRKIVRRIVVEGDLKLIAPARFGGGETSDLVDMPLARNAQGKPLLTGASIAGAARNYLRECGLGYGKAGSPKDLTTLNSKIVRRSH